MPYYEKKEPRLVIYKNKRGEFKMFTGEARVAYFFDLINLTKWVKDEKRYPLPDATSYLPDFTLHCKNLDGLIVEVKNRNYEDVKPIDFLKLQKLYEQGHNILVIRKPVADIHWLREDHDTSGNFFYSGKYIHGADESDMIWFAKNNAGEFTLTKLNLYSGLQFVQEAIEANNYQFTPVYPEPPEIPDNNKLTDMWNWSPE